MQKTAIPVVRGNMWTSAILLSGCNLLFLWHHCCYDLKLQVEVIAQPQCTLVTEGKHYLLTLSMGRMLVIPAPNPSVCGQMECCRSERGYNEICLVIRTKQP